VVIQASHAERCGDIIGRNVRMREIFGMIEKIAPTGATVVIEGETGTGKEVVAQTIHKLSTRRKKPFVVLDCGAVPESLIESELFGHEKGSFTGAIMTRQGLFEMAQSGTIFLDELGELSVDLQPKLLRVLEQREVRRVGSNKPIPIDVRVIAATNRDLEAEVKAGRFREDLFYRLSVVRVLLPPLRERKEDISLLVHHFLREHRYNRDRDDQLKIRHIAPQALRALEAYRWPGNIRELVNVIERACSFAEGDTIEPRDLPEGVLMAAGALLAPPAHPVAAAAPSLEEAHDFPTLPPGMITPARLQEKAFKEAKEEWISAFEKDYIVALLERNQHNISHAAREAEIDRKYFRKLMKKYGIEGGADVGED
jgi:transcriptional regulator with GAF, ATPase, and Fis domain